MRGRWADVLALSVLLILACIPFREVLFDPAEIPAGMDLLQHYSRESFNRRAFAEGSYPLWNPYEFSGFPAQADPQTGVFYPPSVVLRVLPIPLFLTWTIVFHVWLFGAGAYVLARTFGVSRPVAVISAIGLMLGGITIPRVYAGHLDVLRTVAWVPLALALAIRSIDRKAILPSAPLVLVLSCQMLGSFLQVVVYTWLALIAHGLFSSLWPVHGVRSLERARNAATQLALLALLVSGLTAIQLLPTARLVLAAGRTGGMLYEDAVLPAFGFREFLEFVVPSLGDSVRSESWETAAYIGLLPVLLAPLGLFSRQHRRAVWFFGFLGAVTLLFATGGFAYQLHYLAFPMFRIPGRMLVFWAISVGMLAAFALDWLMDEKRLSPLVRRSALLIAVAAVSSDLLRYAQPYLEVRSFDERFLQTLPFVPSPGGRVLSLCESELHATELAAIGVPTVDGYNSYFLADYARFAIRVRKEDPKEMMIGYERIGGRTTLPDLALASMLNVTEIVTCSPAEDDGLKMIAAVKPFYIYRNIGARGRVMGDCDAGPCDADLQITGLIVDRPDGRVRFEVSSPTARMLQLSEPYYPERKAWVDGVETPIEKIHVALSGIRITPGLHLVELRYVPTSLRAGAVLSLMTALLWVLVLIRTRV